LFLRGVDEYSSCDETPSGKEEEEDNEKVYPSVGELMMIRRTLNNQTSVNLETQRENIFHTRCKVLENIYSLIVDSGSCCNCCSARMVEKLHLQVVPHPNPYKLQWINEDGELTVDKKVKVEFYVGNYKDNVICDVVPMEACHILLGRPRQFDKKTMHNGLTNEITFTHNEKKSILNPLPHLQVVRDQVQMKQKRDEEKKKIKFEKERALREQKAWEKSVPSHKVIQQDNTSKNTFENMLLVEQPQSFIFCKGTCTDQVILCDDVAASDNIGVLNGTPGRQKGCKSGSQYSRRSLKWRSPISDVRNRRSPKLRHSRRM